MKKIGICGTSPSFERFVRGAVPGAKLVRFPGVREAVEAARTDAYEALLLLPGAEGALLPAVDFNTFLALAALRRAGQKLYAELYDAGDYGARELFGFIADAPMRGFYDEYVVWRGELLQARGAKYLPGRAKPEDIVAAVEDCLGSHIPAIPGAHRFPIIIRRESYWYAAVALSRFDRLTMLPHAGWRALFAEIFSALLGVNAQAVEASFDRVYPPMGLAGCDAVDRESLERAVLAALHWHLDSGVMPDRSGESGMYEMIRSMDLSVRANQRVDTILLTSALMVTAGTYFHAPDWTVRGEALARYGFEKGIQYESGANDGLFRWFVDSGIGPDSIFSSDNGRDAMALMQLYRVTGKTVYFERLKRQTEMFLRWLDGDAYFKQTSFSAAQHDIASLLRSEIACNSPVFYEGPVIALSYLFKKTGDIRYFEAVKRITEAILRDDPHFTTNYTPLTHNFLFSRMITVLLSAQEIGCGDYADRINELLDFFIGLQSPSGGIADHSMVDEGKSLAHAEFSISMGKGRDAICDFLYCVNNLMGACSLALAMKRPLGVNMAQVKTLGEGLTRFTLGAQIRDADARVDGGWMRAFDLEGNEYFGVNRDKDWGPYCVMGGWVMGFLPLLLLAQLGQPSIYAVE